MAIAFPVTPPAFGVRAETWSLEQAVGLSESPYTYSQEVYEHAGKRLRLDVQLVPMKRADAQAWIAFLASLRGRVGTFTWSPTIEGTARGTPTGTPLVKGAGQTGGTLLIDGASAGVTGWLKAGDWVQLGTGATARLHKNLVDTNSNGSGEVTLELWPGPRVAPADNEAVVVSSPRGLFRLASNTVQWDVQLAQIFGLSFSAVEAL